LTTARAGRQIAECAKGIRHQDQPFIVAFDRPSIGDGASSAGAQCRRDVIVSVVMIAMQRHEGRPGSKSA
jgi:hypothetical protein